MTFFFPTNYRYAKLSLKLQFHPKKSRQKAYALRTKKSKPSKDQTQNVKCRPRTDYATGTPHFLMDAKFVVTHGYIYAAVLPTKHKS